MTSPCRTSSDQQGAKPWNLAPLMNRSLAFSIVNYLKRPSLAKAASGSALAASLSQHRMLATRVNDKTLFDYMSPGIDVNLKIGTPGETLLRRSTEYMKKAALHRLVRIVVAVVLTSV